MEEELEAVGIRLNKKKPNIYYKPRKTGGLAITSMVPLTKIDEKLVHSILAEYSLVFYFCCITFFSEKSLTNELMSISRNFQR